MAARQSPLNVLQVASSLFDWGGIERYVVFLSDGLFQRGHEVTVACPPGSPLATRLSNTAPIALARKLDLRAFAAYLRLFRSQRFDVVHGHFSPDFLLPGYAARLTKQPLTVMTRHVAIPWHKAKARSYSRLWDRIIPVSHAVERRLLESGIPQSQMTVAKAGLPAPRAQGNRKAARSALGLSESQFVAGSFGRLTPEKGTEVFVQAIGATSGVHGCIFGRGPEEAVLRAKASAAVSFHGQIAEVADAMTAMDVIVIPSVWEEAFPYAALEAMALGVPIVASRIGGLPEMVEDGVNGRLFEPGNSGDLAKTFAELREDRATRERMGSSGKERYTREFTVDQMVDRILAVYVRE